MAERLRVALIGCGSLGISIAWGLLRSQDTNLELRLCDRNATKTAGIVKEFANKFLLATTSVHEAVENADVVLIVVKPKDVFRAVAQVRDALTPETLLVSCAAGITINALEAVVGAKIAIARAIPNTAVSVNAGTTGVFFGRHCDVARDEKRLHRIFDAVGHVRTVDSEDSLHAVTALSSSGPAFVLVALEAMIEAGMRAGLARSDADFFARGALASASALVDHGVLPPSELRHQITSPGGTTAEGLYALEKTGFRYGMMSAIDSAFKRSKELTTQEPPVSMV